MNLPKRKSNRLPRYDYSQNGAYFVTMCVKNMHKILGSVENKNVVLSSIGEVVKEEIENVPKIRGEIEIAHYVIMPNHIHLIVHIVGADGDPPESNTQENIRADCHPPLHRKSISNMVQGFKGAVTRKIGYSIWQRSYYDHVIRSREQYHQICKYIHENPLYWAEDMYNI